MLLPQSTIILPEMLSEPYALFTLMILIKSRTCCLLVVRDYRLECVSWVKSGRVLALGMGLH